MTEIEHPNDDIDIEPVEERVRRMVEACDGVGLTALIEPLPSNEALRAISLLTPDDRDVVLTLLPAELAAELIDAAPNDLAVDLMERLKADKAAEIVDELDSDVQADIIGELDEEDAEAILAQMDPEDAEDVRRLATYDDDTAGGLMTADVFTVRETDTVAGLLQRLASDDEEYERFRGHHPYVLDADERPIGVVTLHSLLTAHRKTPLADIMVPPLTVTVDASLDGLRALFDEHTYLGVPVVEADGRLAGVVARDAVGEAELERSETESLKRQGLVADELRTMPVLVRSRRRLSWLSANIVLNIIAASVIAAYEETLAALVAIAVFLPMVSDMSGCSGNQAVAVSMRELSLGLVRPIDAMRVWLKELSVGLINGTALGILIGLVAWMWKGNMYLGLVIGAALAVNTVVAVSVGGLVPLLLRKLGQDPAVASGPLLTTITDMAGFFLVLSLATAMMPLLIG